ncbi:hypothetical protein SCHPADRAFT_87131 [Schizopora paradoxa]|uniref:Uncharacterized protein n=1 Tax=Schizopora paradoxa TaxID=27342 RepID=A0A0H2S4I0_9AGAM|nr:hypothetical protein SCHPADRAFT_87131 [Schizopora paradoxa]
MLDCASCGDLVASHTIQMLILPRCLKRGFPSDQRLTHVDDSSLRRSLGRVKSRLLSSDSDVRREHFKSTQSAGVSRLGDRLRLIAAIVRLWETRSRNGHLRTDRIKSILLRTRGQPYGRCADWLNSMVRFDDRQLGALSLQSSYRHHTSALTPALLTRRVANNEPHEEEKRDATLRQSYRPTNLRRRHQPHCWPEFRRVLKTSERIWCRLCMATLRRTSVEQCAYASQEATEFTPRRCDLLRSSLQKILTMLMVGSKPHLASQIDDQLSWGGEVDFKSSKNETRNRMKKGGRVEM